MGYYDGRGMDTDAGSSYDVACTLNLPVILVINCRGAALLWRLLSAEWQSSGLTAISAGYSLNRVSKMLYPRLKAMLEQELGKYGHKIPVLGYVPEDDAFRLESRHLGLVTPEELTDLKEQTERAGKILTESVDLEQLLKIAGVAPEIKTSENETAGSEVHREKQERYARIAIARDEAFCFYYKANLEMLEAAGLEPVPFSPLRDEKLPEDISGLILGGGYPELYGKSSRPTGRFWRRSENGWKQDFRALPSAADLCICMRRWKIKTAIHIPWRE